MADRVRDFLRPPGATRADEESELRDWTGSLCQPPNRASGREARLVPLLVLRCCSRFRLYRNPAPANQPQPGKTFEQRTFSQDGRLIHPTAGAWPAPSIRSLCAQSVRKKVEADLPVCLTPGRPPGLPPHSFSAAQKKGLTLSWQRATNVTHRPGIHA